MILYTLVSGALPFDGTNLKVCVCVYVDVYLRDHDKSTKAFFSPATSVPCQSMYELRLMPSWFIGTP